MASNECIELLFARVVVWKHSGGHRTPPDDTSFDLSASRVGSREYALVAIFSPTIIPLVSRGPILKALLTARFGFLLVTVGVTPMSAVPRFHLGMFELTDGPSFITVLLGIFAIAEMIKISAYHGSRDESEYTLSILIDTASDRRR